MAAAWLAFLASARPALDAALASDDQRFLARCRYNMGVVSYRQALDAMQSFQDARGFAVAAIRHLRASLVLQPEQADTRFNLELGYRLVLPVYDARDIGV